MQLLHTSSKMLTFQLEASVPTAELPSSEMSFDWGERGLAAPGSPTFRNFRIGAGGGQDALRPDRVERKYPVIQPLNTSGLERTRTVIPPMQRNFYLHKRDLQHPFSLSQELSRSHAGRPFPMGSSSRYEPSTSPSVLFPPTLVLKGRNAYLAENCKLSRPRVKYPTYNISVKDNQKRQSFPDPMVGAPRSFLHRISELSTLEGETIRQEKRLKLKKGRKPPS